MRHTTRRDTPARKRRTDELIGRLASQRLVEALEVSRRAERELEVAKPAVGFEGESHGARMTPGRARP